MKNESNQNVSVYQNLKDAGCNNAMIQNFLQMQVEGKTTVQLQLLTAQRRLLLNTVHEKQKNLDCLDHLIYEIKSHIN